MMENCPICGNDQCYCDFEQEVVELQNEIVRLEEENRILREIIDERNN